MDLGLRCLSAVPMNRALALAISWRECKGIALGGAFFWTRAADLLFTAAQPGRIVCDDRLW